MVEAESRTKLSCRVYTFSDEAVKEETAKVPSSIDSTEDC
jgi:hypothetical protein